MSFSRNWMACCTCRRNQRRLSGGAGVKPIASNRAAGSSSWMVDASSPGPAIWNARAGKFRCREPPGIASLSQARQRQEMDSASRRRDFKGFTDYQQFFDYDALPQRIRAADELGRTLAAQLQELRRTRFKAALASNDPRLSSDHKQILADYLAAE